MMRSESIFGDAKLTIDMIVRNARTDMETTEMQAPDTVPSLYSLGTAW